jgi:hypothetical protein
MWNLNSLNIGKYYIDFSWGQKKYSLKYRTSLNAETLNCDFALFSPNSSFLA